jgi:hypothetical protein
LGNAAVNGTIAPSLVRNSSKDLNKQLPIPFMARKAEKEACISAVRNVIYRSLPNIVTKTLTPDPLSKGRVPKAG